MGKCGRRVFTVQSAQGQPDAAAGADVSKAISVRADGASAAPQRPAVSAELSARQLARLFILGYRTRSVDRNDPACCGATHKMVLYPIRMACDRNAGVGR